MILAKHTKQPAETKDYDITYDEWLADMGDETKEAAATVVCLSDPGDTALTCDLVERRPTFVKFWMSGGTHMAKYKLTCMLETRDGRTDESELVFNIKEY